MKTIETDGITYIDLIPYGTNEWYYGISYEHGDLYEAEEVFKEGYDVEGRNLCLIHYPDGEVYRPVPKQPGIFFMTNCVSYGAKKSQITLSPPR